MSDLLIKFRANNGWCTGRLNPSKPNTATAITHCEKELDSGKGFNALDDHPQIFNITNPINAIMLETVSITTTPPKIGEAIYIQTINYGKIPGIAHYPIYSQYDGSKRPVPGSTVRGFIFKLKYDSLHRSKILDDSGTSGSPIYNSKGAWIGVFKGAANNVYFAAMMN